MPNRLEDAGVRRAILVLFFLSGACGLVYEVVWMRMLTLVFGVTAFATSTILASFFAGLALGGFYFGRLVDKGRNPLLIYASLEAGIGIFAFLMPLLFLGLSALYVATAQRFALSFHQISLLRFVLCFAVLVIPATLMGGTLPVMVKFFARRPERLGWSVGQLYSVNTFGAVLGALAAGFFLILLVGVRESAYVAGVANLLIAGIVVALERSLRPSPAASSAPGSGASAPGEPGADAASRNIARLALWAVGISGFCALALEVFWTRALVFFLDNSTHAFATILTAFLLGIAIGSLLIARLVDTRRKLLTWLGVIQLLIGVSAALAVPILSGSTSVFRSMQGISLDAMLHWKWIGMRFVKCLSVMLVPTVLMGMTFPLVAKIYTRNLGMVGTALGNVYSVNTMAGVLGSMVAGFVLIPLIGVQNGIMLVAAINIALGGILLLSEPLITASTSRRVAVGFGFSLPGLAILYLMIGGPMHLASYYEGIDRPEVLSYTEGVGATVKVYRDRVGDRTLSVNGFPVAGTGLAAHDAQKPLAHFPLLLSTVASPKVNIIGFGAGGTSWGIMQYDPSEVDCVELVPAVLDAAGWFPDINHGVLDDPAFTVILDDGRNHVLVSDKQYDVISIDATTPKMAGNGSLYTREFYELLAARLSPDGLVVQWLPFHLLSDEEMRMIVKTFMTAFPHTTLWFSPLRHHSILVGTQAKLVIDFGALRRKLERQSIQHELAYFAPVTDPIDFLGWFVMGEGALAKYASSARVNSDNHPYLEFTPAMAYFRSDSYRVRNLLTLRQWRESAFPLLVDVGETDEEIAAVAESVQRRFEATHHSIGGDIYATLRRPTDALAEYNSALLIDPQEKIALNPMWRSERPRR
ncbi:MAG: fused MFS/spermidine synthase [Gemmatimonadota bacterium]|nr:fused MFS/spermidine synthase [Gemmatimonadota bacterium]